MVFLHLSCLIFIRKCWRGDLGPIVLISSQYWKGHIHAPNCSLTSVILQDREEKTRKKEKSIAEKNQGNFLEC